MDNINISGLSFNFSKKPGDGRVELFWKGIPLGEFANYQNSWFKFGTKPFESSGEDKKVVLLGNHDHQKVLDKIQKLKAVATILRSTDSQGTSRSKRQSIRDKVYPLAKEWGVDVDWLLKAQKDPDSMQKLVRQDAVKAYACRKTLMSLSENLKSFIDGKGDAVDRLNELKKVADTLIQSEGDPALSLLSQFHRMMESVIDESDQQSLRVFQLNSYVDVSQFPDLSQMIESYAQKIHACALSETDQDLKNELLEKAIQISRLLPSIAETTQTYGAEGEEVWNNDAAFVNPVTKTVAVFDGAGHNKKDVYDREQSLYKEIFESISRAYQEKQDFSSKEEAVKPIREILTKMSAVFRKNADELMNKGISAMGPALYIGQVVRIDDKLVLVTAQTSDCALCIKKKKGELQWFGAIEDYGLGDWNSSPVAGTVKLYGIEEGDELFLFSDGIGEFLSRAELGRLFKDSAPEELLPKIRKAITAHPDKNKERKVSTRKRACDPERECKVHNDDARHKSDYDDLALSYLKVI